MRYSLSLDRSITWYITIMLIITVLTGIVNIPYSNPLLIAMGMICYLFRMLSLRKNEVIDVIAMFFLFSVAVLGAAVNYGGYGTAIACVYGVLISSICRRVVFGKIQLISILAFCFFAYLYWMVKSPTAYDVFIDAQSWDSRYEGVMNANGVGILISYTSILFFNFSRLFNNKYINYLGWIMIVGGTWGIYNARSRMALAVTLLFILVVLVFKIKFLKDKKVKILKALLYSGIVVEIIFPFIYLFMYQIGFASDYVFADTAEKGLYSGRQKIWGLAFDNINSFGDWFIGIGSYHDFWEGHDTLNMHNNFMNLLVVTGLLGVFIYYSYIIKCFMDTIKRYNLSEFQYLMLLFFVCIIFEGASDVTLFYTIFNPFVYIPFGLVLNSYYSKFAL